jgi:CubicO group peptidase (beta-lactamase class C family)
MRFPWIATASVCIWLCAIGSNESSAVDLEQILKGSRVPGLSLAVIRDGKIVESKALGVRDTSTDIPVDVNTVFEAASLSKPVLPTPCCSLSMLDNCRSYPLVTVRTELRQE